jgi:hypothetical protein
LASMGAKFQVNEDRMRGKKAKIQSEEI